MKNTFEHFGQLPMSTTQTINVARTSTDGSMDIMQQNTPGGGGRGNGMHGASSNSMSMGTVGGGTPSTSFTAPGVTTTPGGVMGSGTSSPGNISTGTRGQTSSRLPMMGLASGEGQGCNPGGPPGGHPPGGLGTSRWPCQITWDWWRKPWREPWRKPWRQPWKPWVWEEEEDNPLDN